MNDDVSHAVLTCWQYFREVCRHRGQVCSRSGQWCTRKACPVVAEIEKDLEEEVEDGKEATIPVRQVIKLAEDYECCHTCGSESIGGHFCHECKQQFVQLTDAVFFAGKIRRMFPVVESGGGDEQVSGG